MAQTPEPTTELNIIPAAERQAAARKIYQLKIDEASKKVIENVEQAYQKHIQTNSSPKVTLDVADINKNIDYTLSFNDLYDVIAKHYEPKGYSVRCYYPHENGNQYITIAPAAPTQSCCQLL